MTEAPRSHLMHPWAVVILTYWLTLGLSLMVSAGVPRWKPVVVVASVDDWVSLLIGGCLASGSALSLAAGRRWRYRSTRYGMERIGLIILAGGWVAFAIATMGRFPDQLTGWLQGVACAVACVMRLVEVHQSERATRANVSLLRAADDA